MALYPLQFEPIYKPKVWGGRALEKLGRTLPAGQKIGESWELADLSGSSASGGRGGEERSRILNGPLAGRTLHEVMREFGAQLMGHLKPNDEGNFPLLVKFLDARENLSVQVHPSAQYAAKHPEAHLKSEAWYVLDADPGAVIYKGVKQGTTAEEFRRAIEENRVEGLLIEVPVKAGDAHYLPSGTCHALGAGIVVAEVQTPSDTTFRVYDWGRQGRQLHVAEAMQCIELGPAQTQRHEPGTKIQRDQTLVQRLVRCEFFTMDRVVMQRGYQQELTDIQPTVWMVLGGGGRIVCECEQLAGRSTQLSAGRTVLLPGGLKHARVHAEEDLTVLEVGFPQAMGDLLA
jgi:mannose-6-phosphate isomerase